LTGTFDPGTPQVAIAGPYGTQGIWTPHQAQLDTMPYVSDIVTITKGKHTLKFGTQWTRYRTDFPTTLYANGRFYFNPYETNLPDAPNGLASSTGMAYASFLLGDVDAATVYGPNLDSERFWSQNFFAQDEHRATSKLTLTYGVSWELQNILASAHSQNMSQFNPNIPNAAAGGLPGALQFIGFGTGRMNRERFTNMPLHDFGPRLGFAYLLTPKTTVRGSYGIGYGPLGQALSSAWANHQGFLLELTAASADGGITPSFNWDGGFPVSRYNLNVPDLDPTVGNNSATSFVGFGPIKAPMIQLVNFTVQRQLAGNIVLSGAYIGNFSHHIGSVSSQLVNQLDYSKYGYLGSTLTDQIGSPQAIAAGINAPYAGFQGSVAQALRPYPQYLGINGDSSMIGNSTYHALQIKAQKTFSNGLSFLIGYTISKQLADVDTMPGYFAATVQNAYNMRGEKSVTSIDMPQAVVASYVYQLPIGTGRQYLHGNDIVSKYVLGGWSIAGVHSYDAGTPLGFSTTGRLPTTGDSILNVATVLRPDVVSGVSPTTGIGCGGSFDPATSLLLNRAAFTDPAPFTFGTAPRLSSNARSCASFNENISLLKRTPIKERSNLELGFDVFNVFNRRHFGGPDSNIDDASFGQVSSAGPGRTAQLHLKLLW